MGSTMLDDIETLRLRGERLGAHHLPELMRMHTDPVVMATLNGVKTEAETTAFRDAQIAHWEKHGYGVWIIRDRDDGAFVGRAGIRNVTVGGREEVEVMYGLMAEYWGRGLATELTHAFASIAFETLRLSDLVAFTLTTNRASQRVMEKSGFVYERDVEHWGLAHVLYRRLRTPERI